MFGFASPMPFIRSTSPLLPKLGQRSPVVASSAMQARVGRAHDDARGAIAAVALGRAVVTHAATRAVEADGRDLHLRIELPALRAGFGIERDDDVHRRAHVQQVADLQRRRLELPGAARAVVPDFFQAADVRGVDLIETRVTRAVRRVAVVMPFSGGLSRRCRCHFAAVRGGSSLARVARTDDEDCDDRERAGRCDRSASSAAEQRGRRLRRVQSATRKRRQQPRAEHAQEYQARRERPQIGADFEQRPEQRCDEQRAVDARTELVAAPEKNRRRQQCDAGQHVVERAAHREQPHAAVQKRDRHEQDDRGEDARRTMHYFPFGRNASSTLPGAWLN